MCVGFWVLEMCALILRAVELQKIKLEFSSYAARHCWWEMNKQKHILLWSLVIARTKHTKAHRTEQLLHVNFNFYAGEMI